MDNNTFWQLIDEARSGHDCNAMARVIQLRLESMTIDDVSEFCYRFDELLGLMYNSDLSGLMILVEDGATDDTFQYFCAWIISQGRTTTTLASAQPSGRLWTNVGQKRLDVLRSHAVCRP
jgi:hypothetical protein